MLLKDVAQIYFSLPAKTVLATNNYWLSPSGLDENNILNIEETNLDFDINTCLTVETGNILIKRISPTYVNLVQDKRHAYLGNNIIKIKVTKYSPPYIAYILEKSLQSLNSLANNSTRFNAINRNMLEQIEIPDIPLAEQNKIGEIWKLGKQKQRLIKQLLEKEKLKQTIYENKILINLGGNKNDRN